MKRALWTYPKFIAHRCGGALMPENTLAGLRLAARLGFRAVEFDVMLSADGIPMIIHDETLERTTNGKGHVADMRAAKLHELDAGMKHHRAFSGEGLPRLDEMLAACLALGLSANVEIKPAAGCDAETGTVAAQIVQSFVAEIAGVRAGAPFLLSSFSRLALEAARTAAPLLPRALLVEELPEDWRTRMQASGCCAVHCDATRLRKELAIEIIAAGIPLACYTVNRTDVAAELFALGVSSIFTDRLDLFDPSGDAWAISR